MLLAICQTNFSDSITHGPRINTGRLPPMEILPTRKAFMPLEKFAVCAQDRQLQMARRVRRRKGTLGCEIRVDKAASNQTENSGAKLPPVCRAEIRNSRRSANRS